MINPLAVHALSLKNQGCKIKPKNGELRITKNGNSYDVCFNILYTNKEIDDMLLELNPAPSDESYFTLKESDQLYLYKPTSINQAFKYYVMSWDVNPDYNIPLNTVFAFYEVNQVFYLRTLVPFV